MASNAVRAYAIDSTENAAPSEWLQAHQALSRLARQRAAADAEEGCWLLAALRTAVHVHLGYGSFHEYVGRLFGYTARSIQEKVRVAEALERLPATANALAGGAIHWSAARELTRVAVAETERDWLEASKGKTVRQLEELVAGAHLGDGPSDPRDPMARRHVLRFEVTGETLALFREAMNELRRQSDERLDDDALLLTLARTVLGGPRDEGRSSYQVSLSVCPECGRGAQVAAGELVEVGAEMMVLAECDGQHMGPTPANESAHVGARADTARAKQTVPPALRRAVLQRDHGGCRVPGCRNAIFVDVHHVQPRSEGGRNEATNLITLCAAHHRAAHRGELRVEQQKGGVRFQHADGSRYGEAPDAQVLAVQAKVFAALRNLGFREVEARAALAAVAREVETGEQSAQELLVAAVARLTR